MNKIIILAAVIALAGFTAFEARAQEQEQKTKQQETEQPSAWDQVDRQQAQPMASIKREEVKEKIFKRQLPAPVQQVLMQEALASWKLDAIYKIDPDSVGQRTEYEIYFTNASQQKARIRVDEVGDIVITRRDTATVQDTLRKK